MIGWVSLTKLFGSRILLTLAGGTALLIMADLAEVSRQLAEQDNPLRTIVEVYGNLLPSLTLQALPVGVLLGVLLAITDLVRSRELLAWRAAGAGAAHLAAPALVISFVLSGVGLFVADQMAPLGVKRATDIQMRELGRMRSAWSPFHREHRWVVARDGGLYNVETITDGGRHLEGLTRYEYADGRLTAVTYVDEMEHDGKEWEPVSTTSWRFDPHDTGRIFVDTEPLRIPEKPSHFSGVDAHPEALTGSALQDAIALRKAQGQPALPFEMEARTRWTMPLMGLALAVLALGLGLVKRPPATHVEAAAVAIGIAFIAWTLLAICRALGLAGMISPTLAAFLPVVLPAAVGVLLLWERR